MFAGMTRKHRIGILIGCALVLCLVFLALADVLMPEEGPENQYQRDGELVVDSTHSADGYIRVKCAKKTSKQLKVKVSVGGSDLIYNIPKESTDYIMLPLQFGRVNYTVGLFRNVEGKKYSPVGQVTVAPRGMEDELRCFLYPNQYVNYTADTECVKLASELCKDMTDQAEIFKTIRNYVISNYAYDYIKSVTVQPGQLPDIDYCWKNKMGICQDLSALTIAMLRSQGVPARLMIGTLGSGTAHAWVLAVVDGEDKFFDPTAELGGSSLVDTYTILRWY